MRAQALAQRIRQAPLLYAFVFLVCLSLLAGAGAILYSVHYVKALQAGQQRQGQQIEQKLCTSLDRLAALQPPPGSPADNPSRAYEQDQHDILSQLGPDIGCRRTP